MIRLEINLIQARKNENGFYEVPTLQSGAVLGLQNKAHPVGVMFSECCGLAQIWRDFDALLASAIPSLRNRSCGNRQSGRARDHPVQHAKQFFER